MTEPSRRRFLRRSVTVSAVLAAGCLDDAPATDTPSSGTPADSGGTQVPTTTSGPGTPDDPATPTETATSTPSPTPPGAVSWWADLESPVEIPPVVSEGSVYAGVEDGTITAHATADGTVRWRFDAERPVRELALADGSLLAVTGTTELGADHTLLALDAATGDRRWTFSPTDWWLELLATRDGRVYVGTADDALGPTGQTLYAVPVADGEPDWSAEIGDPREAVLTEDAVFVSTTGRVFAFERADGSERWRVETPDPTFTTLAAIDGTVLQGFEPEDADVFGILAGFDATTGEERWRVDDRTVTSVGTRGGDLYVGGETVAAVDPADGRTLWASDGAGFVTDAGVGRARVYAGSDDIRAYDRESGEMAWAWTPDPTQGGVQPTGLVGGLLHLDAYHDAEPRNQYKFTVDTDTGESVWTFEDGTALTDLAVGDAAAAVGGENGRLYAFDVPGE